MDTLREKFGKLKLSENPSALQDITNLKHEITKGSKAEEKKSMIFPNIEIDFGKIEKYFLPSKNQRKAILPFDHLISSNVDETALKKFLALTHRGATYSLKFLKGPS